MSALAKAAHEANVDLEAPKSSRRAEKKTSEFKICDAANAVDTLSVLEILGIARAETSRGQMVDCPGCKEPGALVCVDGGQAIGVKCLHDRCAHVGPKGKAGFRSNCDLYVEVHGGTTIKAAQALCERFGIEVPERKAKNADPVDPNPGGFADGLPEGECSGVSADCEGEIVATITVPKTKPAPTAEDPLRGLQHLSVVALLGREKLLELAARPVDYIFQDIAVAGTIILIAGPPAEGKTTLLFLILAGRLNVGEPIQLLGRRLDPAPKGKWVVLIEGEHSEASTSRKLVKSLGLLGLDDAALDRVIIVARKAVRLGSPEWQDIGHLVAAGLVSDIALDTVARVAPADADNEREQVAIFDAVARTIDLAPTDAVKPTVWAVSHTRKNQTSGGLEDVSGSAQRTGQADTVLMIKGEKVDGRTVSTKVTFQKLREDPDDYPLPVTFSIRDGVVHVSDGAEISDDRTLEARVVESLHRGPKTKTGLSEDLKRSREDVDSAIKNLFAARAITTDYMKIRGKQQKVFKLRTDGAVSGRRRMEHDDLGDFAEEPGGGQ
jgi:hypothetical protein